MQSTRGRLEGTTVIRVPPSGFDAPIVLGAVRVDGRLVAVRLEATPATLPEVGADITLQPANEGGWFGHVETGVH